MNYFSKTKIIIKVLGAGQTVGRSCVIVELENRRVMFDCGSHLGYKDERKYPNFNLLVKDDNYDIPGSSFSRRNNRSSNNRNSNNSNSNNSNSNNSNSNNSNSNNSNSNNSNSNNSNSNNSNSNNSNRNSNNINSQWNVGEKNLGEADAYDILNTEVNISIVNSSISDKEKLINNLKRINEIIDCVIISHFHMDHIGALPFFTEILKYKGTIIMSYPTKALSPILLLDSCKLADMKWEKKNFERQIKMLNEKSDELLNYNINCLKKDPWNINEDNIYSCISKVVGLQINETYELGNLSITPYYAGHVLGACIYKLESNNFSIIYTGDYNTVPDKHLGSTKIPSLTPEVFISESTYATYVRPTRKASELELCNLVHECVHKGGKVLIPVFAIGRAQELSILLDDYWKKMKINYPIYFGCGLTENANKYYKIYSSWVSSSCCVPMEKRNLFNFANISPFVNTYLNENRPMVLFATPGMLHTGLSLKAFKAWSGNSKNLVILPGYCVQGTVGHKLIMGEKKIVLDPTTIINVACKIIYLSFSAHADSLGIQQLIKHVLPKNVIFVHGEKNGMEKLSKQISSHYYINSICPSLGQHCEFDFCKDNIQFLYMHYSDYKKILHKINLHIEEASSIPLAQNKDNLNKEEQLNLDLASCSSTCMIPFTTYIFYLSICLKKDPWNINEDNIYSCISKVVGLQINETYELGNLSITPYYAGHVLGACIYKLESNNFSIIYTGDYNTVPDKHLGSTKIPSLTPEVFISESTYATYVRPTRKASELELCNLVHECVHKGGKVLIPVFAIGRAQELSILLDDYWKKMKINYPIYFGCGLTENANKYYKIYSSWVSSSCCVPMEKRNLFNFANISPFVNTYLNENRPMVLFATPGMLHTGLSLKAFKAWSGNSKNLVILPGYCVQGTVGHKLIMGEKKIVLDPTTIINVACKIIYLSFSAHADSLGIQQLIKHVLPKNVIFVHGEKNGMEKLSKQISSHYYINSICPSLGQHCEFDFCKDNIQFLYMHYSDYKKILHKINLHIEEASSIPLAQNKDNLNKEEQLNLDLASCSSTCMIPFTTYIFYLSIRQKPFLLFFSKRVLLLYLKKRSFPIAFCRNGRTFTSERLFGKRDRGLPGGISSGMAGEVPNDMQRGSIRAPSNANQQKTGKLVTPKGNPLTNDENYNSNERGNSNKNILSSTILNCKGDDNILLLDLPCTQDEDVTTIPPASQAGKRKYTEICDNDKWLERDHLKKKNTMKIIKKEIADISDANNMKYLPNEQSYAGSNKSELNYLMRENDKSIYDYNEKHVHYSFSKKDVNSIRYEASVGEIEKDVGKEAEYDMNKGEHTNMDDTSIAESDNGCDNRSDGESWDGERWDGERWYGERWYGESWDGENPFYKYDLGKSIRRYNIERNEDKVILPLLNLRFKESVSISYERFYNFVITFFQEILNSKNKNNVLHFGKSVIIKNVKCNDTYFFLLSFHSLRAIHDGENLLLMQWSYIDDAPESVIRKFINSVHSYNERK
ncbi:cleavage and polyadenylation specificity factor, putative [Plasmodium malariae]|uniref:Cleavage and polyadenylation specificity factor, putative n=1 Tax=Plasmodium malariae TaxID=5858 RepID=A0A1C3KYK9_PLAMA|nr:cleavage and polyadenylation specificity factor, putative [Plasmodium malariae]